jgi:hypothetical protein
MQVMDTTRTNDNYKLHYHSKQSETGGGTGGVISCDFAVATGASQDRKAGGQVSLAGRPRLALGQVGLAAVRVRRPFGDRVKGQRTAS